MNLTKSKRLLSNHSPLRTQCSTKSHEKQKKVSERETERQTEKEREREKNRARERESPMKKRTQIYRQAVKGNISDLVLNWNIQSALFVHARAGMEGYVQAPLASG